VKAEPPCLEDEREGGCLVEAHLGRHRRDGSRRRVGDFPVAAPGEAFVIHEGHHAIAGLKTRPSRRAEHNTAYFRAGDEGKVRLGLVLPRDHEGVEVVDRGGAQADTHHPVSRFALRELFKPNRLRPAELPDDPGLHRGEGYSGGSPWCLPIPHLWDQRSLSIELLRIFGASGA